MVFQSPPKKIHSTYHMLDSGVDGHSCYFLGYENNRTALLSSSIEFTLREEAIIYGEEGYIRIPNFHKAEVLVPVII